ncbi:MAG: cell envelope integrity protein TolA [Gammaproteobacteria bacterium]|nr:cell envelope integrity protein TolA [Gammaproteobacteria bacterium]
MKKSWVENIIAGSYAIALHIILVAMLFIGFGSDSSKVIAPAAVDIVQATVLDEQQVLDDISERQARLEQEKAKEKSRLEEIKRKEAEEKAAKERVERERQKEQERIEQEKQLQLELEREQEIAEQKKKEEEIKRQAEVEKERLAEEKKAEALKKKQQEEEKKRKAEEAKKLKAEKERKAAEEKKRQELERQRLAEEKRRKKEEADRLLQESLAAEEREREERRISGMVNQHMGMIRQRIKRYWSEPSNATKGMQCTLRVSLLPGGDVKKVVIVKSSGNAIFDRSAESAVFKAAPWPQPTEPKAAAVLRDFTFVFKPK